MNGFFYFMPHSITVNVSGSDPEDNSSILFAATVAVADLVMHYAVNVAYMGSNPICHPMAKYY